MLEGVLNTTGGEWLLPPVASLTFRKSTMIATSTESETQEPMLNLRAVAAFLRIGYMTAWKMVKSGTIPSHRIGQQYRVSSLGLHQYLDSTAHKESTR